MIEKTGLIIDYIDTHYHEHIDNDRIEVLTELSSAHIRSEFKTIVDIPLDKYRRRRQQTLIIKEIIDIGFSINKSNLLPWGSPNSFRKTFKKEFNVTLREVINSKEGLDQLQQKFDYNAFTTETRIVNELIDLYGSPSRALEFLLSLPPYKMLKIVNSIDHSLEKKYDFLMLSNHRNTPRREYKQEMKKLRLYYDVENEVSTGNLLINYYVANRKLIKKLGEYSELYLSLCPSDLRTVWYESSQLKKGRSLNKDRQSLDYFVGIPSEFTKGLVDISSLQYAILIEFIIQDNNAIDIETFNELENKIKYNRYKSIHDNSDNGNIKEDGIIKEVHYLLVSGLLYINSEY